MGSSDDEKYRRQMALWRQYLIGESDKRLQETQSLVTRFVQAGMQRERYSESTVRSLITMAHGEIVHTIPHEDGTNQFVVNIKIDFLAALYAGKPVIAVSKIPFSQPAKPMPPHNL